MSELNNEAMVNENEMANVPEETTDWKDGALVAAAGLGCLGAGYLLAKGIDKLKAHAAKKKAEKANEEEKPKKEKVGLIQKFKDKRAEKKAKKETKEEVKEEVKAEEKEES